MSHVVDNWTLDALLEPWTAEAVPVIALTGVNLDSRLVVPGDVYLAVAGATTHGMHYAKSAVENGAVAIVLSQSAKAEFDSVIQELEGQKIPVVTLESLEHVCAGIASRFYRDPDKTMTLIAVTGTDGKTSVCRFIQQALAANQQLCGYIGTLGWGLAGKLQSTELTTPDSVTLRRLLASMRDQGAQIVALEASSHGIAEGRLDGLSLDVAVLTNLGRDHLDYHETIEAYQAAKERLFHWASLQSVVLNADDDMGQHLISSLEHLSCYAYSANGTLSTGDSLSVQARDVITDDSGISFTLIDEAGKQTLASTLLGSFNVDNLLACYASLRACGIAANDAIHGIASVTPVAGRMERLGGAGKPTVVIDFSHTPGALQLAIAAVKVHCEGQLWVVFGCGGDRDKGKRAPMATAAQAADYIVLTDDNPRTESSDGIIQDVLRGFDTLEKVTVIADRGQAIAHALAQARAGDLVLIAGKGHEDYQIVGTQRHHFSDREQALAALELAS